MRARKRPAFYRERMGRYEVKCAWKGDRHFHFGLWPWYIDLLFSAGDSPCRDRGCGDHSDRHFVFSSSVTVLPNQRRPRCEDHCLAPTRHFKTALAPPVWRQKACLVSLSDTFDSNEPQSLTVAHFLTVFTALCMGICGHIAVRFAPCSRLSEDGKTSAEIRSSLTSSAAKAALALNSFRSGQAAYPARCTDCF